MQVGDTLKEVNGELLDDKTPSEGVWVGLECRWVFCLCPFTRIIILNPILPGLASVTVCVACIGLEECIYEGFRSSAGVMISQCTCQPFCVVVGEC